MSWTSRTGTAAAAMLLTTVAACGGGGDADDPDGPIVIGISIPLTGDYAEPGKGVEEGYRAWAETVNDSGGLLGRDVELKILDDRSNSETVVADYEALIGQDQVDLVLGPYSSRLTIPAARVAEEYGMLFVEPAGNSPQVFEEGFEYLIYSGPGVTDRSYDHLAAHLESMPEGERPQTAAFAVMDDPFASSTANAFRDQLEDMGVEIVVDEIYPPSQTDFTAIATQISQSNADIVVGGTTYQDGVNMILALQQLDYQPKLAAFTTAPTHPEFPSALGSDTSGILSPTTYTPEATHETNPEFVEAWVEEHGEQPNEDNAAAYATGQVLQAAVEAVGCAEQGDCQAELRDWLKANEVATVVGPLSWDEQGRPTGGLMIQQWIDDEIRIVLPADVAEGEFIYPKPAW